MITEKEIRLFTEENKHTAIKFNPPSEFVHLIPKYEHCYEIFPYVYNSIVTCNGKIIDKQSFYRSASKYKVIYDGNKTTVILEDGSKGIAKRHPDDPYDKQLAKEIAYTRAKIKSLQKKLKKLVNKN